MEDVVRAAIRRYVDTTENVAALAWEVVDRDRELLDRLGR